MHRTGNEKQDSLNPFPSVRFARSLLPVALLPLSSKPAHVLDRDANPDAVNGNVTYPSGAAVASASVVVTGDPSKSSRKCASGTGGSHPLTLLFLGTYRLTVSAL